MESESDNKLEINALLPILACRGFSANFSITNSVEILESLFLWAFISAKLFNRFSVIVDLVGASSSFNKLKLLSLSFDVIG